MNTEKTIRSAKLRAAIISLLDKGPKTRLELITELGDLLKELNYTHGALDGLMYTMKGKLIHSEKYGNKSIYSLINGVGTEPLKVKAIAKVAPKVPEQPIKIDLIEKTGKLRIEFNGLLIEIGKI